MLHKRKANFWANEDNNRDVEEASKKYFSNNGIHPLVKRGRETNDEPIQESTSRRLGVNDIDAFYNNMTWTKVKKKKKKKKKPDPETTTKAWVWSKNIDEEAKQLWKPFNWDVEHTKKINESGESTEKTTYEHGNVTGNITKQGSHPIEWPELVDQEISTRKSYHEFNESFWKSYNWDLEHNETIWRIFKWNMEHNETYRRIYNWNMEHKNKVGQQVESSTEHSRNVSVTTLESNIPEPTESNQGNNFQFSDKNGYQEYNETFWRTYNWNIEHNMTYRKQFQWNIEHNETFRRIYNWNMEHYHISSENISITNEGLSTAQLDTSSSESKESSNESTVEWTTQENNEFNATYWKEYNWNIEHNSTFRKTFEWNMEYNEKFRTMYNLNMERLKNVNQSVTGVSSTSEYNYGATSTQLGISSSEFKEASRENTIELTTQENNDLNAKFWEEYNWNIEHNATFRKIFEWNMEYNEKFKTMYNLNMERLKNSNQSISKSTSDHNDEEASTKLETSSSELDKATKENTVELLTTQENMEPPKNSNQSISKSTSDYNDEEASTKLGTSSSELEKASGKNKVELLTTQDNIEHLKNISQATSEVASGTEGLKELEEITTQERKLNTVPKKATAITELSEKEKFQLHSVADVLLNSEDSEKTITPEEVQTLGESDKEIGEDHMSTSPEAEGIVTEGNVSQESTEAELGPENSEASASGEGEPSTQFQNTVEEISVRSDQKVESNIYQDYDEGKVNELGELEKQRLFSIADYLLDPKNFEATYRTTIVTNNGGSGSASNNSPTNEAAGTTGFGITSTKSQVVSAKEEMLLSPKEESAANAKTSKQAETLEKSFSSVVPVTRSEYETLSSNFMKNKSNVPSNESNEEAVSNGQTESVAMLSHGTVSYSEQITASSTDSVTPEAAPHTILLSTATQLTSENLNRLNAYEYYASTEERNGHSDGTQESETSEECEESVENDIDNELDRSSSKQHSISSTIEPSLKRTETLTTLSKSLSLEQDGSTVNEKDTTTLAYSISKSSNTEVASEIGTENIRNNMKTSYTETSTQQASEKFAPQQSSISSKATAEMTHHGEISLGTKMTTEFVATETQEGTSLQECEECEENVTLASANTEAATSNVDGKDTTTLAYSISKSSNTELASEVGTQNIPNNKKTPNTETSTGQASEKFAPQQDLMQQSSISSKATAEMTHHGEISLGTKMPTELVATKAQEGTTLQECEECEENVTLASSNTETATSTVDENVSVKNLSESNKTLSEKIHEAKNEEQLTTNRTASITQMTTIETHTTSAVLNKLPNIPSRRINVASELPHTENIEIPFTATHGEPTSEQSNDTDTGSKISIVMGSTEEAISETCQETEDQDSNDKVATETSFFSENRATGAGGVTDINTDQSEGRITANLHPEESVTISGTAATAHTETVSVEHQTQNDIHQKYTLKTNGYIEIGQSGGTQVDTEEMYSVKTTIESTQSINASMEQQTNETIKGHSTAAEEISEEYVTSTQTINESTSQENSRVIQGKEGHLEVVTNRFNIADETLTRHPTIYLDFTSNKSTLTEQEIEQTFITTATPESYSDTSIQITGDFHSSVSNIENTGHSTESSKALKEEQNTATSYFTGSEPASKAFGTTSETILSKERDKIYQEVPETESSSYSAEAKKTSEIVENTLETTSSKDLVNTVGSGVPDNEPTERGASRSSTETETGSIVSFSDNETTTCITSGENEGITNQSETGVDEEGSRSGTEQQISERITDTTGAYLGISTQHFLLTEHFSSQYASFGVTELSSNTGSTPAMYSEIVTTSNLGQTQVIPTGHVTNSISKTENGLPYFSMETEATKHSSTSEDQSFTANQSAEAEFSSTNTRKYLNTTKTSSRTEYAGSSGEHFNEAHSTQKFQITNDELGRASVDQSSETESGEMTSSHIANSELHAAEKSSSTLNFVSSINEAKYTISDHSIKSEITERTSANYSTEIEVGKITSHSFPYSEEHVSQEGSSTENIVSGSTEAESTSVQYSKEQAEAQTSQPTETPSQLSTENKVTEMTSELNGNIAGQPSTEMSTASQPTDLRIMNNDQAQKISDNKTSSHSSFTSADQVSSSVPGSIVFTTTETQISQPNNINGASMRATNSDKTPYRTSFEIYTVLSTSENNSQEPFETYTILSTSKPQETSVETSEIHSTKANSLSTNERLVTLGGSSSFMIPPNGSTETNTSPHVSQEDLRGVVATSEQDTENSTNDIQASSGHSVVSVEEPVSTSEEEQHIVKLSSTQQPSSEDTLSERMTESNGVTRGHRVSNAEYTTEGHRIHSADIASSEATTDTLKSTSAETDHSIEVSKINITRTESPTQLVDKNIMTETTGITNENIEETSCWEVSEITHDNGVTTVSDHLMHFNQNTSSNEITTITSRGEETSEMSFNESSKMNTVVTIEDSVGHLMVSGTSMSYANLSTGINSLHSINDEITEYKASTLSSSQFSGTASEGRSIEPIEMSSKVTEEITRTSTEMQHHPTGENTLDNLSETGPSIVSVQQTQATFVISASNMENKNIEVSSTRISLNQNGKDTIISTLETEKGSEIVTSSSNKEEIKSSSEYNAGTEESKATDEVTNVGDSSTQRNNHYGQSIKSMIDTEKPSGQPHFNESTNEYTSIVSNGEQTSQKGSEDNSTEVSQVEMDITPLTVGPQSPLTEHPATEKNSKEYPMETKSSTSIGKMSSKESTESRSVEPTIASEVTDIHSMIVTVEQTSTYSSESLPKDHSTEHHDITEASTEIPGETQVSSGQTIASNEKSISEASLTSNYQSTIFAEPEKSSPELSTVPEQDEEHSMRTASTGVNENMETTSKGMNSGEEFHVSQFSTTQMRITAEDSSEAQNLSNTDQIEISSSKSSIETQQSEINISEINVSGTTSISSEGSANTVEEHDEETTSSTTEEILSRSRSQETASAKHPSIGTTIAVFSSETHAQTNTVNANIKKLETCECHIIDQTDVTPNKRIEVKIYFQTNSSEDTTLITSGNVPVSENHSLTNRGTKITDISQYHTSTTEKVADKATAMSEAQIDQTVAFPEMPASKATITVRDVHADEHLNEVLFSEHETSTICVICQPEGETAENKRKPAGNTDIMEEQLDDFNFQNKEETSTICELCEDKNGNVSNWETTVKQDALDNILAASPKEEIEEFNFHKHESTICQLCSDLDSTEKVSHAGTETESFLASQSPEEEYSEKTGITVIPGESVPPFGTPGSRGHLTTANKEEQSMSIEGQTVRATESEEHHSNVPDHGKQSTSSKSTNTWENLDENEETVKPISKSHRTYSTTRKALTMRQNEATMWNEQDEDMTTEVSVLLHNIEHPERSTTGFHTASGTSKIYEENRTKTIGQEESGSELSTDMKGTAHTITSKQKENDAELTTTEGASNLVVITSSTVTQYERVTNYTNAGITTTITEEQTSYLTETEAGKIITEETEEQNKYNVQTEEKVAVTVTTNELSTTTEHDTNTSEQRETLITNTVETSEIDTNPTRHTTTAQYASNIVEEETGGSEITKEFTRSSELHRTGELLEHHEDEDMNSKPTTLGENQINFSKSTDQNITEGEYESTKGGTQESEFLVEEKHSTTLEPIEEKWITQNQKQNNYKSSTANEGIVETQSTVIVLSVSTVAFTQDTNTESQYTTLAQKEGQSTDLDHFKETTTSELPTIELETVCTELSTGDEVNVSAREKSEKVPTNAQQAGTASPLIAETEINDGKHGNPSSEGNKETESTVEVHLETAEATKKMENQEEATTEGNKFNTEDNNTISAKEEETKSTVVHHSENAETIEYHSKITTKEMEPTSESDKNEMIEHSTDSTASDIESSSHSVGDESSQEEKTKSSQEEQNNEQTAENELKTDHQEKSTSVMEMEERITVQTTESSIEAETKLSSQDKDTENELESESKNNTTNGESSLSTISHFEGVTSKYSLTATVPRNETVSNSAGHTMSQPTEVVEEFFHFSKTGGSTLCETCEGKTRTSDHRGTSSTKLGSQQTENEQVTTEEYTTTGTTQNVKKESQTSEDTFTTGESGVTAKTEQSSKEGVRLDHSTKTEEESSDNTENPSGSNSVASENVSNYESSTTEHSTHVSDIHEIGTSPSNDEFSKNNSSSQKDITLEQSNATAEGSSHTPSGSRESSVHDSESTICAEDSTASAASAINLHNQTHSESIYMLTVTEPPCAQTGAPEVIETENEATIKDRQKDQSEKPLVVVVNNSGNKHEKLNDSVIEGIINKPLSDVELQYIDLNNVSQEAPNGINLRGKPNNEHKAVNCSKSDYESNKACLCDIDNYVRNIERKLKNNVEINDKDLECKQFFSAHEGIVVSNSTKPAKRKKRSLMFLTTSAGSNKVVEKDSIQDVIGEDYRVPSTDSDVIVLPGSTVNIPCESTPDNSMGGLSTTFAWTFKKDIQRKGEVLANTESSLQIQNIEAKDYGNYTCRKTRNGKTDEYLHEVQLVTFPIYKIKMEVSYSTLESCTLELEDMMYSYLPKIVSSKLCGDSGKMCEADVQRPRCTQMEESNVLDVTIIATINNFSGLLLGAVVSKCDLACKLKLYASAIKLVYKNFQILKNLPVTIQLNFKTELTPKSSDTLSKFTILCAGGYGLEKEKQRVCVLCPRNTFGSDDGSYCKYCPNGQYQPEPGSKSCMACTSPVDDSMCLRMLYSDTEMFKIYVGVGFGLVLAIILAILYWNTAYGRKNLKYGTTYEGSLRDRVCKSRMRHATDVEKALTEPLLKKPRIPPDVPPPDF